jgi:hypothetical protein
MHELEAGKNFNSANRLPLLLESSQQHFDYGSPKSSSRGVGGGNDICSFPEVV